ncbi:MAG: alcohol dehydrogenase catalytic domain-containing protein [Micromonosporaceae bacterium]
MNERRPMTTRAAVLTEIGAPRPYARSRPLTVAELELDPPGEGELLVRVEAAGVCHSDLSVVDGSRVRPVPMALGHEAAGVVVDVGPAVRDVRPGDHVVLVFVPACGSCPHCNAGTPALCAPAATANGAGTLLRGAHRLRRNGTAVHHHLGVSAFSEYAVVDRASAVVIPDDVPFPVAALFGCALLTGVGAVQHTVSVRPGESVAVFGLGGVGLAAVMGAAVAGAYPLIAVDPVAAKRDLALELGATHALHPDDVPEGLPAEAVGGVRYAVEAVGHPGALAAAYTATGRGGTTVTVGLPHPDAELRLPALSLVTEAKTLVGSYLGSAAPQRDVPRLVALWRAGRLPVERLHSASLPLERINEAMDDLADAGVVRQIILPVQR